MRFALDARTIQDYYPGIGRYAYDLVRALAGLMREDTLVVLHDPTVPNTRYALDPLPPAPGLEWEECRIPVRSWQEQVRLPAWARQQGIRVFHAPYYVRPYFLPCPAVVTVYDIISHLYPAYLPSRSARWAFEVATRLSLLTARRVIVPSFATALDLHEHYGVGLHRMAIIPLAAAPEFHPQPPEEVRQMLDNLAIPPFYVLYLGTHKPHKNLVRLMEAWALAMASWPEAEARPALVVAGPTDSRYPAAMQRVQELNLGGGVYWLGPVPERALPALYAGAALFVFPSLYEGFGLPVLEAMACSAPVACAATPALKELVGDAAALFDPLDVEGMARTVGELLRDREARQRLRERGLARAAVFSWERTARATLTVYREAAR
ncbi:MAG: glycosyltransferase family 4 protein [Anaerolineae bacterium]